MATDYAARIVARATGEPLAAAPPMAPRGAAATPDAIDPFEGGVPEESRAERAPPSPPADARLEPHASLDLAPLAPLAAEARRNAEVLARRVDPDPASMVAPPARREVLQHERIVERVFERVEQREVVAETPESEPAIEELVVGDTSRREAHPPAVNATSMRAVEKDAPREAPRPAEAPVAAPPIQAVPRRLATHAVHVSQPSARAPLHPRAAQPEPRRPPERPRLVIERLIVEVVPPAAVAPRPAARVAGPAPRPFRAGGPSSVVVGRPSGLGQG